MQTLGELSAVTPFWWWMLGWWLGVGATAALMVLNIVYLERHEQESRFSFLWGFYKRASSETHVYSRWCWGAFTFVRARLAVEKETVGAYAARTKDIATQEGMRWWEELLAGRITIEQYREGPPKKTPPSPLQNRALMHASTPNPVTVPATVAHAPPLHATKVPVYEGHPTYASDGWADAAEDSDDEEDD